MSDTDDEIYNAVFDGLGCRRGESLQEGARRLGARGPRQRRRAVRLVKACAGQPADVQWSNLWRAALLLGWRP